MIIVYEGQEYEITNWPEFEEKLLKAIGFQIEAEIIKQINELRLVQTGKLKQQVYSKVENGVLEVGNSAEYAVYLEFGTLQYYEQYGLQSYPSTPHPKKKDMPRKKREMYPRGVQPFGFMRRVFRNKNKMAQIVNKAVQSASK
jgi:hypothetical protein